MDGMTTALDHCTCPTGQPCACGFAAMLSVLFFGDDGVTA